MPDAPIIRRLKTYTADTGLVYQYYFVGKRPFPGNSSAGTEFIFDASSDRHTTYAITVLLHADAVSAWGEAHGRALAETEQYAAAKLRLLRAFDETADLADCLRRFAISAEVLEELLEGIGLD
jgi:hypothetical protein